MLIATEIIAKLKLQPLPEEGGYYLETYRSAELIPRAALPARYAADKSFCTAIYYLLTPETFSGMHRIPTDEIFHFLLGDPVTMLQLYPNGTGKTLTLGSGIDKGQAPHVVVEKGVWQGSALQPGGAFALFSVTVAPGFDFSDYENGDRKNLVVAYPEFRELIEKLTRSYEPHLNTRI